MVQKYNDPAGGTPSTHEGAGSSQMNTFYWQRKALIEARTEMFFMPMADTTTMPKHYGKEIRVHHWMPLLDDRNINDQGLDAAGATYANGNLYGSSKDIGTINSRLPTLSEEGGRVNRVGFTRLMRKGTMLKFGFFHEFTQELLDFDSEDDLYENLNREAVTGAVKLTEAVLQKELLAGAGVVVYAGAATADNEITGETDAQEISEVTYEDLTRLRRVLFENRTPKQTKVITGSRMIDTKVINSGYITYIGVELEATVRAMVDGFGNPAFVGVEKYAGATTPLNGEIGAVDQFRFIVVPEMLHWAGAGAAEGANNGGYETTSGNYNIYPMLTIGAGSFTTIGFQTGGKEMKFKVITKMPGKQTADRTDPYGETGFSSIKWWHGTMILRPERLAVIKTVARS